MITLLGRELRKIRIDRGELLFDMAEKLGMSPSYLSSIENGKRSIPCDLVTKVVSVYSLNEVQTFNLRNAEADSVEEANINLNNKSLQQRNVALLLARKFDSFDSDQLEALYQIINGSKEGKK